MKIGILSDTHNLLREEVIRQLTGCDMILHAGDISSPNILESLKAIAPVKAVRGNNDGDWAEALPLTLDFELCGLRFFMAHKKKDLSKEASDYDVMICGHSHQYKEEWLKDANGRHTLVFNPGSCGPVRFRQPITMAILTIGTDGWHVERIEIERLQKDAALSVKQADIKRQIEIVVKETRKGQCVSAIAKKYALDPDLVEQIMRLYVTHPGVTADGIMTKMGF